MDRSRTNDTQNAANSTAALLVELRKISALLDQQNVALSDLLRTTRFGRTSLGPMLFTRWYDVGVTPIEIGKPAREPRLFTIEVHDATGQRSDHLYLSVDQATTGGLSLPLDKAYRLADGTAFSLTLDRGQRLFVSARVEARSVLEYQVGDFTHAVAAPASRTGTVRVFVLASRN